MASIQKGIKFKSITEFFQFLPEEERIITDVLRQIVQAHLPPNCKEKFAYNVPFYYLKKRIMLIWPASVPWGGVRSGVLLGFCQGNKMNDEQTYLDRGTNKQVYYKIYKSIEEIDEEAIIPLIYEAVRVDGLK